MRRAAPGGLALSLGARALGALALAWVALGGLAPEGALAHQGGIELSGLEVVVEGAEVEVWVHTHLHNVLSLVPMDDDRDGVVRADEAAAHVGAWQAYMLERIRLRVDGAPCVGRPGAHDLTTLNQFLHAEVRFTCPKATGTLEVESRLLSEQERPHQFLLAAMIDGQEHNKMMDTRRPVVSLPLGGGGAGAAGDAGGAAGAAGAAGAVGGEAWEGAWSAAWIGIEHILGGPDHVLFVVLLLVVTWRFGLLLAQITAFTVAHSLTLLLAVYQVVTLPEWLVESVIAASILAVALDNGWRAKGMSLCLQGSEPSRARGVLWQRASMAFAFGLVHGLGFASALGDLGQGAGWRWLLGFNAGVEAGQVAVILCIWPALRFAAMPRPWYPKVVLGVSAVSGAVALWWVAERLPWGGP
jgi:hypothetical protein